jgi:hypothetical protein
MNYCKEAGRNGISYKQIKRRNANCIGHFLVTNSILKHIIVGKIEGRIEATERRERRRKKLLDDLKEMRGYC